MNGKIIKQCLKDLEHLIGNTPLLEIHCKVFGKEKIIYAKAEAANGLTNSIKDRLALYVIQQAYQTNSIKPEATIIEATSGNTGIAFAAVGRSTRPSGNHSHAKLDERREKKNPYWIWGKIS